MGTIAKVTAGGATHLIASTAYATCSTGASTTAKVATIQDSQAFSLIAGETVHIYFTYNNTATAPTLNVNSTGAKPIRLYGTQVPTDSGYCTSWRAQSLVSFTYNTTLVSTGCWLMNDAVSARDTLVLTPDVDYQTASIAISEALSNNRNVALRVNNSTTGETEFYTLHQIETDGTHLFTGVLSTDEGETNVKIKWWKLNPSYGWDTEFTRTLLTDSTEVSVANLTISGTSVTTTFTYFWADDFKYGNGKLYLGSDGLYYTPVSLPGNRTFILYTVDNANSQIKIITLSAPDSATNMSGTLTTIPIGGSGGGSYILEYGQPVTAADVLSAMQDGSVIVCYDDEDPNFFYAYLDDHYAQSTTLDFLEFIRTSVSTTETVVYKYTWDSSQTSVNNGWSLTSYTIPNAYPYLQATGNDTSQRTLTQNAITQIQLVSTGSIGFGTGLTISSGGIQVASAGVYKVSGSVKMRSATTGTTYGRKALITSGSSFSNSTEVTGAGANGSASLLDGVAIPAKLVSLSANDIVFLCAKSLDGEGLAEEHSVETYLLVERVASQGDAGISQAINYLPNADITSY